jgi:PPM family protein phosphatase
VRDPRARTPAPVVPGPSSRVDEAASGGPTPPAWAHVTIVCTSASDIGRARAVNEDALLVDEELGLYVVCDGVGGRPGGDVAARTATSSVRQSVRTFRSMLEAVARGEESIETAAQILVLALESASHRIAALARLDPARARMGTTCTAVLVCGRHAIMAHVGDSRFYLVSGSVASQLSDDHTLCAELRRVGHPGAEDSTNASPLLRWLGAGSTAPVDTLVLSLSPGETLLLCSDGLTRHVPTGRELAELLSRCGDNAASELVDIANSRGGEDNVTAIVLRVDGSAPAQSSTSPWTARLDSKAREHGTERHGTA